MSEATNAVKYTIHCVGEFWELFDEQNKTTVYVNPDRNNVIMTRKQIMDIGYTEWFAARRGQITN